MGELGQPGCAYRHLEESNTEVAEVSGSSRIRFYQLLGGHTAVLRVPPPPPRPVRLSTPLQIRSQSQNGSLSSKCPLLHLGRRHSPLPSVCLGTFPSRHLPCGHRTCVWQGSAVPSDSPRRPVWPVLPFWHCLSETSQWGHSQIFIGFALHVKK